MTFWGIYFKGFFLCLQLGVFIFHSLLLGPQFTFQSSAPWAHTSLKSSKKVSLGAIIYFALFSWPTNTGSCSLPCPLHWPIYTGNNQRMTLRWCQASLRWYFGNIWAKLAEATRNKIYNSSWNRAQRKMFICLLKIVPIHPSSLLMVKNLEWPDLKNHRRQPANTSFIKR